MRVCARGSPALAEPAGPVDEVPAEVQLLAACARFSSAVGPAEPQGGPGHDPESRSLWSHLAPLSGLQQEALRTALDDVDEVFLRDAAAPQEVLVELQEVHGPSAAAQTAGGPQDQGADGGHGGPTEAGGRLTCWDRTGGGAVHRLHLRHRKEFTGNDNIKYFCRQQLLTFCSSCHGESRCHFRI